MRLDVEGMEVGTKMKRLDEKETGAEVQWGVMLVVEAEVKALT